MPNKLGNYAVQEQFTIRIKLKLYIPTVVKYAPIPFGKD